VLGLTRDPLHGETIWAVAGRGAFVEAAASSTLPAPARASTAPDVQSSIIGVDLGYDDAMGIGQIALMSRIFPRVQTIRILGSAALGIAYAGCGRLDFFTHMNLAPWDIAAGIAIVQEAGGVATERDGSPLRITSRTIAAGGAAVHADFRAKYGD
jgi:fructose-1,6-bisphosphatase/inositol monophosphatase family enzyme